MPRKRDDESGQFTATVTDDEIIRLLAKHNGAGTGEVANAFNIEQASAYRRLKRLEDGGRVVSRKIGGSMLWTATDDTSDADGTKSAPSAPESVEGVDVDALDLPGRGDDLRRRQAAMRAVLDHLRENGKAQARDLRELAFEVDGGTYADARSLWKNAVLPALGSVEVAESSGPSGKWRWAGDG